MRAAIYARYSSDLQRETSIEDQLAVARRYAEDHGWKVLKDHIYTDAAMPRREHQREGRHSAPALLGGPAAEKPFDVVLVDDSSFSSAAFWPRSEVARVRGRFRRGRTSIAYGES